MGDRVSFSSDVLSFDQIAEVYGDLDRSIRFYYTAPHLERRDPKFVGYSVKDVREEMDTRLREMDQSAALSILASLEASFRIDYLLRCYQKLKDGLSRRFRLVYGSKKDRAHLETDILEGWKVHEPTAKALISEITSAFKYRHWLAHGRYWVPKLGRRYDFFSVYLLAQRMDPFFEATRR